MGHSGMVSKDIREKGNMEKVIKVMEKEKGKNGSYRAPGKAIGKGLN